MCLISAVGGAPLLPPLLDDDDELMKNAAFVVVGLGRAANIDFVATNPTLGRAATASKASRVAVVVRVRALMVK